MPIEPGQTIDNKYRVVRRIGEGGMGTVYEGLNVRIDRRVAIKVLHEQVASLPEFAQRFEREARAAARIGSPHVCDVLDLGDLENGERYIVMEFLDGTSLEDRIAAGAMSPDELAPIAFEILDGLGTMHHAGVIHRDLKPANVFLARVPNKKREMVKILDFGIAKLQPRADDPAQMTGTGMMMGTPLYMSPEQARGAREVDGRSDLYSASVIFYRALTGELPYSAANLNELLFKIVLEDPKDAREHRPDLDEAFAEIVMKGLARDRDRRHATAREYQEAIAAWGRARGRTSLTFTVSLPSTPPPTPMPISAPAPPAPNTVALGPKHDKLSSGTLKAADGTPVAWSGNPIAAAALASGEHPAAAAMSAPPPATSRPPSTPPPAPAPAVTAASPRASRTPLFAAVGAGAIVVFGFAAMRARGEDEAKPVPAVSAESAAIVAPPPPVTAAVASSAVAEPEPPASAEPEEPPANTTATATANAPAPAKPTATAKRPATTAPATTAAPAASTAPAAAPTSTHRRKFRTDL